VSGPPGPGGEEREVRVEVDGLGLHVRRRGPDGALPLVLLHGFPFSGAMWAPQLEGLSERRDVVAPDIRGHGRSDPGDGQVTIELFVDDLLRVLDHLRIGPVVGCGLSMGGYVLLRALEREPGRFLGAVLADTRPGADDDAAKLARAEAVRSLRTEGAGPLAERLVPRVLGPTTLSSRPAVVRAVTDMILANPVRGMAGALLAMAARTDTTHVLPGLLMPVLAIAGEEDALTPPDEARRMAKAAPDGRLVVIAGAGHVSSLERPDAFNDALRTFLDEVEGSRVAGR